jgi:hypothetical protein
MDSPAGGSVHVDAGILEPTAPEGRTLIGWRPPGRGDRIAFDLTFNASTTSSFGSNPSGGKVGYHFGDLAPAADIRFVLKSDGATWSAKNVLSGDFLPGASRHDYQAWAVFNDIATPGLLAKLWVTRSVQVSVVSKGKSVANATFDLHDLRSRDQLLARSLAAITSSDQNFCNAGYGEFSTNMKYWCRESGGVNCFAPKASSGPLLLSPVR